MSVSFFFLLQSHKPVSYEGWKEEQKGRKKYKWKQKERGKNGRTTRQGRNGGAKKWERGKGWYKVRSVGNLMRERRGPTGGKRAKERERKTKKCRRRNQTRAKIKTAPQRMYKKNKRSNQRNTR